MWKKEYNFNMKRTGIFIVLLVAALLLSGCATHRQVVETNLQLMEVRQEHQQIKASLARLDSLMAEQIATSRKLNADFGVGMKELEDRMAMVESRLEDAGTMVNKAVQTMEIRKPTSDSSDAGKTSDDLNPESLYRSAYKDVVKGNYDSAIKGFEEYLKQYPKTALSDNACYWIGDCLYTQKNYEKAQGWFERLIKDYPDSENMAATKLKLGFSLFNQKNKTKAKQYFQDVIKNYPGSTEANQASDMLKRYGSK
jgi:tol-pal system protein YbgF